MPIIEVDQLAKAFRRPKQFDGPLGGLRTLVTCQYDTAHAVEGDRRTETTTGNGRSPVTVCR